MRIVLLRESGVGVKFRLPTPKKKFRLPTPDSQLFFTQGVGSRGKIPTPDSRLPKNPPTPDSDSEALDSSLLTYCISYCLYTLSNYFKSIYIREK